MDQHSEILDKCPECDKLFVKDSKNLAQHMERDHTVNLDCDQCPKTGFTCRVDLRKHKLTHKPPSDQPFPCNQCDKGFGMKSQLKAHTASAHESAKKAAEADMELETDKLFYFPQEGARDLSVPYQCKRCVRGFGQIDSYR